MKKLVTMLNAFVEVNFGLRVLGITIVVSIFLSLTTYRNFHSFNQTYIDNRKQGVVHSIRIGWTGIERIPIFPPQASAVKNSGFYRKRKLLRGKTPKSI